MTGKIISHYKVLEKLGAKITAISVVVDREEGAKDRIGERYTFLPLVTVSELFERRDVSPVEER